MKAKLNREDLDHLISEASKHQMTPAEKDAQVRSFAYGNTKLSNDRITRGDIDRAADKLKEPA
jgi:hypothetical protein